MLATTTKLESIVFHASSGVLELYAYAHGASVAIVGNLVARAIIPWHLAWRKMRPFPAVLPPMSTKSRQTIYGGQIIGAKIRAQSARKRAAEAAREADRAGAEAWSIQMEGCGGPAQPSPTIGQCLKSRKRRCRGQVGEARRGWLRLWRTTMEHREG